LPELRLWHEDELANACWNSRFALAATFDDWRPCTVD